MEKRTYLCIDLKSFFASVECVERKLDALTTNLVVADKSRTEKTICLAVSPSLKSFGIGGRARLFEVVSKVKMVNEQRKKEAGIREFTGESYDFKELMKDKTLKVGYVVAPPRMAYYMKYSSQIYNIYLKYVAPEDIHVYSIDEVFIDLTNYLKTYKKTPRELAITMIRNVLKETGITATAGIGTNMYLAKVAMDIVAKKIKPDKDGVRIAELDEMSYRKELWNHTPITDFWRVGKGYEKRLKKEGLNTMGDIARLSTTEFGENKLFKMFGVNAEFLIDHAWGWEPCTIEDIRGYKPENKSIGTGQVLHSPYEFNKARLITKEMTELLSLDLVRKGVLTNQLVLTVGYDIDNLKGEHNYTGEITTDPYGRSIPKHSHGTKNLKEHTSSSKLMLKAMTELFDEIVDRTLLIRRINVVANNVLSEKEFKEKAHHYQIDMFENYEEKEKMLKKEQSIQKAILKIKDKFGKNAVIKGMNLKEGATSIDRNKQIGGHHE